MSKYDALLKAGYKPTEILDFVIEEEPEIGQKIKAAREDEFSDIEIINFLKKGPPDTKAKLKDIGEQTAKKGTASTLGSYGDILDLVHAQTRDPQSEAQEAKARMEFDAPEKILPFLQDDDILPQYQRLASQSEIEKLIEMLGGPGEAKTEAGRIAGRGVELAGGTGMLGGPAAAAVAGGSGLMGQLLRELGFEKSGTGVELGTALGQLGYGLKNMFAQKPVTKPSGMPERKFESLKKPTKVSRGTLSKAMKEVESDFRGLTEEILKSRNKSFTALRDDPAFEGKIRDIFKKVEDLAENVTDTVPARNYNSLLKQEAQRIGTKGFELSESEKTAKNILNKGVVAERFTAKQLIEQYRKNNRELGKYLPFGEKAAENMGKREALLAKNKAIAQIIDGHYGKTELGKLFKFSNQRWSEIRKIETVDNFVDSIFGADKIAHGQALQALKGGKRANQLENALGKQGFNEFKTLSKDLLDQEKALRLMEASGYSWDDIGKNALAFMLKPQLAKAKLGIDTVTKAYRSGLSSPQSIRDWKKGVKLINKGKVKDGVALLSKISSTDPQ